jgi:hypothetical protein
MNFIKTTFSFCIFFMTSFTHTSQNDNKTSCPDDLIKATQNISITNIQQTNLFPNLSENTTRIFIAMEHSHDTFATTFHYSNGDHETITLVGSGGMRESYNHSTGKTIRMNFEQGSH